MRNILLAVVFAVREQRFFVSPSPVQTVPLHSFEKSHVGTGAPLQLAEPVLYTRQGDTLVRSTTPGDFALKCGAVTLMLHLGVAVACRAVSSRPPRVTATLSADVRRAGRGVFVGRRSARPPVPRAQLVLRAPLKRPWETAQVPRGKVSMNPLKNLVSINDQRVASVSHIVLAPGKCTLPLQEALDLLETWKAEIGNDKEKFAERARSDSQCPTAADGGDLGFVVRKNLSQQFDDIIFSEEPGKVYGPITTPAGLHLIFLTSCREPKSRGEALLGLPFSLGDQGKKDESKQ